MVKITRSLTLALLVLLLAACSSNDTVRVAPEVGAYAPDFELEDISGDIVRLSDFRGKPVLVNFWATWCPPCVMEMPGIRASYEAHYPDLAVLAVNVGEEVDVVRSFTLYYSLSFDPLLDQYGDVVKLYQVRGNPTSFFIDAEGIIRVVHIGMMTEDQLDQYLTKIGLE